MEIEIKGYKVQIDEEDYKAIAHRKWHIASKERDLIAGNIYFASYVRKTERFIFGAHKIMLHRFVLKQYPNDGRYIDHISGDTLDNRKCNLRQASSAENSHNMSKMIHNVSGYKGVVKRVDRYIASIRGEGRNQHIGTFTTLEDAARAYDMVAIYFFGEFARTNFSRDSYKQEDIETLIKHIKARQASPKKRKYHYVGKHSKNNSWIVHYIQNGIKKYGGSFRTEEEAAHKADEYILKYNGNRSLLNFPQEEEI